MGMHEREVVSGMTVFVAVVEHGSLAAAARRTGLTPSAVSKVVTRLEQRMGVRLLQRTTRHMTVTDEGQAYYERSRAILEELRSVDQEMATQTAEPRGTVRVSAPLLLGQTRVVPSLLAFQKAFPRVCLDLDLTDRMTDLVGERIDVAVRITAAPPPSFVARQVGRMERVLCASPAYLRAHKAPRAPRDLIDHACLVLAGPGAAPLWSFAPAEGPGETVRVEGRLRASSTLSLYEAAKAGLGIAELPRYLVAEDLRERRLVAVLEHLVPTSRGIYVLTAPAKLLPLRVRELVRHLVEDLRAKLEMTCPAAPKVAPAEAAQRRGGRGGRALSG